MLVFTRQGLPQLAGSSVEGVYKGGYVVHDAPNPKIVFVASGSEVSLCIEVCGPVHSTRGCVRVRT